MVLNLTLLLLSFLFRCQFSQLSCISTGRLFCSLSKPGPPILFLRLTQAHMGFDHFPPSITRQSVPFNTVGSSIFSFLSRVLCSHIWWEYPQGLFSTHIHTNQKWHCRKNEWQWVHSWLLGNETQWIQSLVFYSWVHSSEVDSVNLAIS